MADSPDATATIATALATHANQHSHDLTTHNTTPQDQLDAISQAHAHGATALGFLAGLADDKAGTTTGRLKETADATSPAAVNAVSTCTTTITTTPTSHTPPPDPSSSPWKPTPPPSHP